MNEAKLYLKSALRSLFEKINCCFFRDILPILFLIAFSWLLFGPFTEAERPFLRNYLIFPILIWLAFKLNWRGMTSALVLCSLIAIWYTWQGYGIFGFKNRDQFENLFSLFMFISVIFFSGLFLKILISKQKESEKALTKSEKKFRTFADFTYDWEYWRGRDGKIIYISPSCERVSGYTPKEYIKDSTFIEKIIHPEDLELFKNHLHKVDSSENDRDSEEINFRIIRKDGSIAHISHLCTPVFDENGNYNGRRVSNRDKTERKKFEERVAHLASFPELNPNPVIELDLEGNIIYVNRSAKKTTLEITEQESVKEILPKNIKEIVQKMLTKKIDWIENEFQIKNSVFILHISFIISSRSIRIYFFDISNLKKAEKELLETQKKLRLSAEKQLIESYQHLGKINRKISLITDLENYVSTKKDKQQIIEYILTSAINLSGATTGFFFTSPDEKTFRLLSQRTETVTARAEVHSLKSSILKQLVLFEKRMNGPIELCNNDLFKNPDKLTYFVILPLFKRNLIKGFIFLGLENTLSLDTEDLEFLDVFAKHASEALIKTNILK